MEICGETLPMWDMLIEPVVRIFALIWRADEGTGPRWFAVGCLVLILAGIGLLALIYGR
jgi:hypothetical protein